MITKTNYQGTKNIFFKTNRPWITFNTYFDIETGLEVPAENIGGNYIIIKIDKNVRTTKTHRIAERNITVRKLQYKQLSFPY